METGRVPPLTRSMLTLFGVGYLPGGATAASLCAVGTWLVLSYSGAPFTGLVGLFAVILVVAMAALMNGQIGEDLKEIVVDEFLGMYAALLFLPAPDFRLALALCVAFRVIDILKPPPFSWIERWRSLNAILLDDIAIGVSLGVAYTLIARGMHP
jgi:phosphatidylglycerophosphatase A